MFVSFLQATCTFASHIYNSFASRICMFLANNLHICKPYLQSFASRICKFFASHLLICKPYLHIICKSYLQVISKLSASHLQIMNKSFWRYICNLYLQIISTSYLRVFWKLYLQFIIANNTYKLFASHLIHFDWFWLFWNFCSLSPLL